MAYDTLTIKETDEIGNHLATYIYSNGSSQSTSKSTLKERSLNEEQRVDIVLPSKRTSTSYIASLLDVFLPVGYPNSVSADYLEYQIYDSLQAFSSSIAGLLSSRAVLQGVGVGDATASPTAALLLNVLQESMGRIATILFAHRLGTAIEPECKMYRLAADVFNDCAMIFDCLSPVFPRPVRVTLLSFSSVLRALCGVAAGSAKASLSVHFAKTGNLGELNAKDSSQETVISLMGMLFGSLVVSYISSPLATWIALLFLLAIHLGTNYLAVRAVKMTTLNRQRANIVFSTLFDENRVLTPEEASRPERIFEKDGVLRWRGTAVTYGRCSIGARLDELLNSGSHNSRGTSIRPRDIDFVALLELFDKEDYILWFDERSRIATIVLKTGAPPTSQLKAWSHALMVSRHLHEESEAGARRKGAWRGKDEKLNNTLSLGSAVLPTLQLTLGLHTENFEQQINWLKTAGWNVDTPALETRPGRRCQLLRID